MGPSRPSAAAGVDDAGAACVRDEAPPTPSPTVHAAGGVIRRRRADGAIELAVVHRPSYDDWTFPKGKLLEGESAEDAALREVWEETGLRCVLEGQAGCTEYLDKKGREKMVCYWLMRPLDGDFVPNSEVDDLRWVTVEEAMRQLSYPADHALLASLNMTSR